MQTIKHPPSSILLQLCCVWCTLALLFQTTACSGGPAVNTDGHKTEQPSTQREASSESTGAKEPLTELAVEKAQEQPKDEPTPQEEPATDAAPRDEPNPKDDHLVDVDPRDSVQLDQVEPVQELDPPSDKAAPPDQKPTPVNVLCPPLGPVPDCIPGKTGACYFVSPQGDDKNIGSLQKPFRTVTHGLKQLKVGDTLSIRAGTYRLMDEDPTTTQKSLHGTAQKFATIQGYKNERPRILGSLSTANKTWSKHNGTLWRLSTDFLPHNPAGMHAGKTRIEHVMKVVSGIRSHADIRDLKAPGHWTIADANGTGCPSANRSGCFLYLYPRAGIDPNKQVYELSQRKLLFALGSSYLVVRQLEIIYVQNSALTVEEGKNQLIENNIFAHVSNSNDNSYSVFISYGGGAVTRYNKVYDSRYWGGFSNSRGITYMTYDSKNPPLIECNEVFDIMGMGITTKGGVSNAIVRYNTIHHTGRAIEIPVSRCHWKKSNCVKGDPEYHPGGGWKIYQNFFYQNQSTVVRNNSGVDDVKIYNNLFFNNDSGVDLSLGGKNWWIANNIFIKNKRAIYANNGSSGNTATLADFFKIFASDHNLFFNNTADYFLRVDWKGPDHSGTGRSLGEVQSMYKRETASIAKDPLFVNLSKGDHHLQSSSPARAKGDATPFGKKQCDIGMYPNPQ